MGCVLWSIWRLRSVWKVGKTFERSVRRLGSREVVWNVENMCGRSSDRVGGQQVLSEAGRTAQFKPRPHDVTEARPRPHDVTHPQSQICFSLSKQYVVIFPLREAWEGEERRGKDGGEVGRMGETWEGWGRRGKDGGDVGRMGKTWEGRERHGKNGKDVGRVCTSCRWCVEVVGGVWTVW